MNLELFPCSGGLAEGLRRAGIRMGMAFDKSADACDSYERNHGHRPIQIDVNDLADMIRAGWRPTEEIDFFCADPPCTPWSRAGKRLGTADERDCLHVTAEIILALRPRAYLIGNVPGLEDSTSWHVVQEVLAPLAAAGYCVRDFASLNAVSFGVPQFRSRPFWFGHLDGPCVKWPAPTHGPATSQASFDGHALLPYVTCRLALEHLPLADLGRPVNMRLRERGEDGRKNGGDDTRCSSPEESARTVTARQHHKGGQILLGNHRHPTAEMGAPAPAPAPAFRTKANAGAQGANVLAAPRSHDRHPESTLDQPGLTIKTNGGRNSRGGTSLKVDGVTQLERTKGPSRGARGTTFATGENPAPAVLGNEMGNGTTLEWPWDRPSTVVSAGDTRLPQPGHHSSGSGSSTQHGPNAVILSERAAAILQGFPDGECTGHRGTVDEADGRFVPDDKGELVADGNRPGEKCRICGDVRRWHFAGATKSARWAQIGMALPPPMGEAVGRAIAEQRKAANGS